MLLERRDIDLPQPAAAPLLAFSVFDGFVPVGRPMPDGRAHQLPTPQVSIQQRYCTYLK